MPQSGRFIRLDQREINRDTFVEPWPEAGLAVVDSPYDPAPGLCIADGHVLEMDGKARAGFDTLDAFIANHALGFAAGCTPAKLVEIIGHMNVLEMMMGLCQKAV